MRKRTIASTGGTAQTDMLSGHIKIDGGGRSYNDAARREFEHYRALLHNKEVSYKMTREEMLERLIFLKKAWGYISEEAIKRDGLLTLYEINKEFGSIAAARKQVKCEMRKSAKQELKSVKDVKTISELRQEVETEMKEVEEVTGDEMARKLEEARERHEKRKVSLTENGAALAGLSKKGIEPSREDAKLIENDTKGEKKMTESKKVRVKFTAEMVHDKVLELAQKLGKTPTFDQIKEQSKQDPEFPSPMTVSKHLGAGWQEKMQQELHPVEVVITEPVTDTIDVAIEDDDVQPDLIFDDAEKAREFLDGALRGIDLMSQSMMKFSSSSLVQLNINDATCFIYLTVAK